MTGVPQRRSGAAAGFSLLEMLVVLCVLAAVAALAVPRMQSSAAGAQITRSARALANELRMLRAEAIRTNRPQWLAVEPGGHGFTTSRQAARPFATGIAVQLLSGAAVAGQTIRFLPDGRSSGGSLRVSGEAGNSIIRVDWLTGIVGIEEPSS